MLNHRPLKGTAALTVALALATSTPAGAMPNQTSSSIPSRAGSGLIGATPAAAPTIVHVTAPSGGFDWGDAGIGAAGGIALSILGIGSALAASGRRTRRQTVRQA